jgi:aspartate aminotransferase
MKKFEISKRVKEVQASPIRKLTKYANYAKEKGIHVYHLNIGQPDIKTPKPVLDYLKTFNEEIIKYSPSEGEKDLINAFSNYYKRNNININSDEIIVTTGGSEAILFTLLTICDVNDEIIIFEPYYTNYSGFADKAGVKVIPITTHVENNFKMPDISIIEKSITSKTKAILICNPSNPTGYVYEKDELLKLIDLCERKNLFLISDEVYREFTYDNKKCYSVLELSENDNIIINDSVSKRYSLCGARIGCIATKNRNFLDNCLKLAQARLCSAYIEQKMTCEAIKLDDSYFEEVLKEYEKRRNLVYDKLKEIEGVICEKPQGAFYIIVKLPIDSAENFAKWLLTDFSENNETVMVAPCEGFYFTKGLGIKEIRIAYILNLNDLEKAMNLLKKAIIKYNSISK